MKTLVLTFALVLPGAMSLAFTSITPPLNFPKDKITEEVVTQDQIVIGE